MISSQLLLTAFVLYWLMGQFREEKSELQEQLRHEYMLVHDQLVDSMLMQHLVMPSLEDSLLKQNLLLPSPSDTVLLKIHRQDAFVSDTLADTTSTVVMMKQYFAEVPEDIEIRSLHVEGLAPYDSGSKSIDLTTIISDEERMVRSVKLFINENQEAFQSDTGFHVFAMNLDSCSLVVNMEQVLDRSNWTFALDWPHEDFGGTERKKMHGILLSGGPNRYLPTLHVQHIGIFLIRSVFPQILFALILLILSASALLFSYRSLQRQLALSRLRDDFIGNISHELKTPVATVKIALEALRNYDLQKDPLKSSEYLGMAASELERLERLVTKVLQHEMLNNPSLVLEKEDCNLGDLTRSVVRNMDLPIREAGARVSISEEGEACEVAVDRVYVEGMIMNLIDNSLKYTGDKPEILIKIECRPSGTCLSVSDNGPGIPEQYREQVFEKFFRIPAGNKHNVKGYGLGLNFAAQVMDQHGGSISLKNLIEGGCRFTLQFPPADI